MDELIQEFIDEMQESLRVIDRQWETFAAQNEDPAFIHAVFRLMHTARSTSGFLNLERLEKVAQAGETLTDGLREEGIRPTHKQVEMIHQAIEAVRRILEHVEATGQEPETDYSELIEEINQNLLGIAIEDEAEQQDVYEKLQAELAALAEVEAQAIAAMGKGTKEEQKRLAGKLAVNTHNLPVSLELVDELTEHMAELVVMRNQLVQTAQSQPLPQMNDLVQQIDVKISALQKAMMQTRMQPIGKAWAKLPRIVRAASQDLGKHIELVMEGGESELDYEMLEGVEEALTHLLRRACYHSIETPPQRRAAGKAEKATLQLRAFHHEGMMQIEIADDGQEMGDSGLETIRALLEKIGGTVDALPHEEEGSRYQITLPLTLAITSALLIEAAGQRFALPQFVVQEVVMLQEEQGHHLEWVNGVPVLRLHNHLLPLWSLQQIFAEDRAVEALPAEQTAQAVVVLRAGTTRIGLLVDAVSDMSEMVVEPVSPLLQRLTVFSGNSILGDGSVVMMLSPAGLAKAVNHLAADEPMADEVEAILPEVPEVPVVSAVQKIQHLIDTPREAEPQERDAEALSTSKPRALMVDNSPFFRGLLQPIMEGVGFEVTTADGASEAFDKLERAGYDFDAVVSDIEMPEIDGYEFAEQMKQHAQASAIPLIAISSHDDPQDISRGLDAGFDFYLQKFNADYFRQVLFEALRRSRKEGMRAHG